MFDIRTMSDAIPFGLGVFLTGLISAHLFGPLHGGNKAGNA
jgi:hypothetical protein